jgi:hypothetical protein
VLILLDAPFDPLELGEEGVEGIGDVHSRSLRRRRHLSVGVIDQQLRFDQSDQSSH